MRNFFFWIVVLSSVASYSQNPLQRFQGGNRGGTNASQFDGNKISDFERPPIEDYKIISITRDTTTVDTSLTIAKEYKLNYLRRDRYGLLPFANTGQTNNTLIYNFEKNQGTLPRSMAQARHFNYSEYQDIKYYHVPTPVTDLYFRSAFEQGQQLDAFFTINTSPRLNFSIAYKGLRSLGKYQNALTSTGNFRSTLNYRTKNDRYHIKAHWVAQDLLNQENGGLSQQALTQFLSDDDEFDDRSRLLVNFQDAENILDGTRVYFNHHYVIKQRDSVHNYQLYAGHEFNSENKFYEYRQGAANSLFGDAFEQGSFTDRTDHEEYTNKAFVTLDHDRLGVITFQANITNYNYGYNSILILDEDGDGVEERIPNLLEGNIIAAGGAYRNKIGKLDVNGQAQYNITGDFDGFNIHGEVGYAIAADKYLKGAVTLNSAAANYNHLLYQSNYINYNWFNAPNYETVNTNTLSASLQAPKWVNVEASYSTIDDYAYFGLNQADSLVQSFQTNETLNHLKVTVGREFKYGKFALNSKVTFQQVDGAEGILNVPDVVTRQSLYFTDRLFKNALFLQVGFNFDYFTSYNIDAYDPVLAEFYTQNDQEIGEFPLLDFFVNMKVRQARIFFKAEHFNSSFTGNTFFSAPGYPYRDFNIRFGLVWNFFL